jgi:hypothetical protein
MSTGFDERSRSGEIQISAEMVKLREALASRLHDQVPDDKQKKIDERDKAGVRSSVSVVV